MELVDREKLIAQYSANPESKGFIELIQDDCVVEALKKAEVVDAVLVVHGQWIPQLAIEKTTRGVHSCHTEYRCSICNEVELKDGNYCSNCGAKMDLEDK